MKSMKAAEKEQSTEKEQSQLDKDTDKLDKVILNWKRDIERRRPAETEMNIAVPAEAWSTSDMEDDDSSTLDLEDLEHIAVTPEPHTRTRNKDTRHARGDNRAPRKDTRTRFTGTRNKDTRHAGAGVTRTRRKDTRRAAAREDRRAAAEARSAAEEQVAAAQANEERLAAAQARAAAAQEQLAAAGR